jgi:uncharacterized protein (DUF302 family)
VASLRHAREAKEARVMNVLSVSHQVTRLVFDTGQPYEKFRSRYEAAVPPADPQRRGDFAGRHARWPDLAADPGEPAPHGFVLYWRADMTPLMTTAGERRPCTAYLMGCPAIAEKIYRQDPAVMLYSPLRALIYIDSGDQTQFAVDQPSTVFAGFAEPAVAELGTDLDHQLAELLEALGVKATEVLCPTRVASRLASAPRRASQPDHVNAVRQPTPWDGTRNAGAARTGGQGAG